MSYLGPPAGTGIVSPKIAETSEKWASRGPEDVSGPKSSSSCKGVGGWEERNRRDDHSDNLKAKGKEVVHEFSND